MAEQPMEVAISVFGGLNYRDAQDQLFLRSHSPVQYGGVVGSWVQSPIHPTETPDARNIDFFTQGIGKRRGSIAYAADAGTLAALVLANTDSILGTWYFYNPATLERARYAVSKKTVYGSITTAGAWGAWAQMTAAQGGNYTHPVANATKATATAVQGHIFIGTDQGNPIVTTRGTLTLDDYAYNSTTTTTVNADSNSGQKVLKVASTTKYIVGGRIRINNGGARDETGYVASIQAGTSLTLVTNLASSHTAVQADVVQTEDLFTNAYGSKATNAYTGDWDLGCFLVAACQNRLTFCNGNILINITPSGNTLGSGVWDYGGLGATFITGRGPVQALLCFSPLFQNQVLEYLFYNTPAGWEMQSGFSGADTPQWTTGFRLASHRSYFVSRNWIVYLTEQHELRGYNGVQDINIGARLRNVEQTGPLDTLVLTSTSSINSFGVYDPIKQQGKIFIASAQGNVNDMAFIAQI